ncbi:MAG: hypothetical protein L6R40_008392, partial [Gallowayella cf. fulva]
MVVNIENFHNHVVVALSYWASKISHTQAKNIAHTFGKALSAILVDPNQMVKDLDIFSERDGDQIYRWNGTAIEEIYSCVHQLVGQRASEHPHAAAICSWDGNLTYGELDEMSSRLAYHLATLGIGTEVMVPLCFEKSMWTIVSMMGVMKAGGACVPLEPSHPTARHEAIICDVRATIVLVSPSYTKAFEDIVPRVVTVSPSLLASIPTNRSVLTKPATPRNAAMVLYTSGSTGSPKGVIKEHAAICTNARDHGLAVRLDSESRALQFAPYTFTVSTFEIFTTLMRGGCVCVPSDFDKMNDMARVMEEMKVNWAILTPSYVKLLGSGVFGLRTLVLGGEMLSWDKIKDWIGRITLINGYGSTEGSVPIAGEITKECIAGRAIGTFCWIVDPTNHNKLVPVGSVGELLLGGPGLARGYLNDPEKTAAAFIDAPSWMSKENSQHSERLYKTGDLARYNSDSTISLIGRKDAQVKLRGQRVELGEVEFYLRRAIPTAVDVAVDVIVPADGRNSQTLSAFVCFGDHLDDKVNRTSGKSTASEYLESLVVRLEAELSRSLPQYMIPTAFIALEQLPLTLSRKMDRMKLRQIGAELLLKQFAIYIAAEGEKRWPSTEMEKRIRELWSEVLSVPASAMGLDDNFFRLGGDSISAIKLVAAARGESVSLVVGDVFRHPTLVDMSHVSTDIGSHREAELTPFTLLKGLEATEAICSDVIAQCDITRDMVEDVYPCTPLQEGLLALSTKDSGSYVTRHSLSLPTAVDMNRFRNAWEATVESHAILRTSIVQIKSGMVQVVLKKNIDWLAADSLDTYLEEDQQILMHLGDRLTRYAVVEDAATGVRHFVWTVHHAVYDGWSAPLIFENVDRVYKGTMTKKAAPFNGFIKYLGGIDRSTSDSFWRSQLSGASPSTFFGAPSAKYQTKVNGALEREAHFTRKSNSDITTSTIIRAAWAILTARYIDSSDVTFGATLTGRNAAVAGIEGMVGPTITTVPIRIRFNRARMVNEFLQDVQTQATAMIPFEHTGLQNISRVSQDACTACKFLSLLIIHPMIKEDTNESSLGYGVVSGSIVNFNTYALVMECRLTLNGITITASFDANMIEARQMERIVLQFERTIQQLCLEDATQQVGEIECVSEEEKGEIWDWNGTVPETVDACVHQLIEQRVHEQPNSPAVYSWDGELTYGKLEKVSSLLANCLKDLGVGVEVMVPLCFEKSMWTVVAMLAVMKAGGVCVALDPSHPKTRIQAVLRDVGATIVIASASYAGLVAGKAIQVVTVPGSLFGRPLPASQFQCPSVQPKNAAFVVFTSGSTGNPKGIVLDHYALCTSAAAHGAAMKVGLESRVLQFAAYTFDVSIGEIFTTLIRGGCICIPSEDDRMSNLPGAITRLDVNQAYLTASVASLVRPSDVANLRVLSVGGEAVSEGIVATWADKVHLINIYGPAECSIWSTCNIRLELDSDQANIGRGLGAV